MHPALSVGSPAKNSTRRFFFLFLIIFMPIHILALVSHSLPVVTQIRGHIAGSPSPSPLRYVPSFLSREEFSAFSSLVDSRRIVPIHAARRSQQLILVFFCTFTNKVKISPRWESDSRTNASSIRGQPLFFSHTSTSQLLDKPWSQVWSLLPPGACLQILSRIGFSDPPTARRFFIECC